MKNKHPQTQKYNRILARVFRASAGYNRSIPLKSRFVQWVVPVLFLAIVLSAGNVSAQSVNAADGIPIAWERFGEGETTVVFVHCWTCNRSFWRDQVEPVAEAGYQVVTLDLPGHGESGRERDEWSIYGLANDVTTLVEELDLQRVILVGHSMGAPVSLASAQQLRGRVAGVIAVDALHDAEFQGPEEGTEEFINGLRMNYQGVLEFFFPMFFPPESDPERVAWVMEQVFLADSTAATALMADLVQLNEAELLEGAGVPVRSINAVPYNEMSIPTSVETNRKYADFDAVEMDGVGHFPQLEQPERFNHYLLEMIQALSD